MTDTQKANTREPVIFRKWKRCGTIIAIFPAQFGSHELHTCGSYLHVGQHGACAPIGVIAATTPAAPSEYAKLKRELEAEPYCYQFQIFKRYLHSKWYAERQRRLNAITKETRAPWRYEEAAELSHMEGIKL